MRYVFVVFWCICAFLLFYAAAPGVESALVHHNDVAGHLAWLVFPFACVRAALWELERPR